MHQFVSLLLPIHLLFATPLFANCINLIYPYFGAEYYQNRSKKGEQQQLERT